MARSEAQKAADKRYNERHKGDNVSWGTYLKPDDVKMLDAAVKEHGGGRAAFLRWATEQWNSKK